MPLVATRTTMDDTFLFDREPKDERKPARRFSYYCFVREEMEYRGAKGERTVRSSRVETFSGATREECDEKLSEFIDRNEVILLDDEGHRVALPPGETKP